jgi:hypothetical protein
MLKQITKDTYSKIVIAWFLLMTGWFVILLLLGSKDGANNLAFGAIYGTVLTLFVGVVGLRAAKYWGNWNSVMGKAIILLSLGLLAQFFGQAVFSFYNIVLGVDMPYPSIADIGYFGNIPLYLYGIILLGRASGVKIGLRSFSSQLLAVLVPLAMICVTYALFLQEYDFASTDLLTIILDFGYPIGQGLYVAFAILVYSLSRKVLGGVMKGRIILLLVAYIAQYIADFNFLYQNLNGTWYNGGYGDYLYLIAYVFMGIGLFQVRSVALKLREKEDTNK